LETQAAQVPPEVVKTVSPVVNEIKYAINLYQNKNNKKIEKIVLSGGSALLPNLVNYLGDLLDMRVIIGDPWSRLSYPADLKPLLNEIGPKMSVAVGLALREME
jgi:type IV pilus assembly protein PilM